MKLIKLGERHILRRAGLVVLAGWAPLAIFAALQDGSLQGERLSSFLSDFTVQARSLIAAPLLILADVVSANQLGAIALHFGDSQLLPEHERPRFEAALASTRNLLDLRKAEIGALLLAYGLAAVLVTSIRPDQLPFWQRAVGNGAIPLSLAGWWHALVSAPILLLLLFGWLWKLCLWTRFLRLMSRLDLCLVPAHPDRMAGLKFVGYSVYGFLHVALALATIVAGRAADGVARRGALTTVEMLELGAILCVIAALFAAPPFVFVGVLLREWRRGVFEYGAWASKFGKQFERKWFSSTRLQSEDALKAPDFSSGADLYQIVSNVYAMKIIPIDMTGIAALVATVLLPFLPVVLMTVPIEHILARLKSLLL
ncbi:MAG: hypothetical protein JO234_09920 [Hyphomicrobiales bacterium]|nr:hypothetical protein [Hyphomicrobiales bacterium]